MLALVYSVLMLATVPGNTPVAPGAPHFAQIRSIQGVPRDSAAREVFLQGFRDVCSDSDLPVLLGSGPATEAVPNRFRLLEGDAAEDAWQLVVTVGAPPPILPAVMPTKSRNVVKLPRVAVQRASRGFTLAIAVLSPKEAASDVIPAPVVHHLVVPAIATDTTVVFQRVRAHGVVFRWDQAGRAAGLLALEHLHHASGDLPAARHVSIAPVLAVGEEP